MARSPLVAQRYQGAELFKGCPRNEVELFDSLSTLVTVPAGKVLLRQGAQGRQWLVVAEGRVALDRTGFPLDKAGAGDSLGELALLDERPETFTAIAETSVVVWVFHHADFAYLLRNAPTLRGRVLAVAATRRLASDSADAFTRAG